MADTDLPVLDDRDADRMCMVMARDDFLFFIFRAYPPDVGKLAPTKSPIAFMA